MTSFLSSWLPMVKPLLRSVVVRDPAPWRNALKMMRLRHEFGLVEVRESRS